ncbi:MAG: acyl-ACP--UDP-N-acetylglucosamine O-acyltransferase [bacterium]
MDLNSEIHPTAIIHPLAKLGQQIKIGPYSIIGENVALGDGCVVGPHVVIDGHTTIGKNNTMFHGVSLGGAPQDLKYEGRKTYLEIGDGNTFREFFTAHRGSGTGGTTKIGSHCFLMATAHVAHDCTIGDGVTIANAVHLAGHVRIDDYATVGGVTPVHQFVSIGKYAFVGGGSRVERDIPPFIKAAGNPTRVYGINSIGLERHGFSSEKRAIIKRMFNLLYRSDLNVTQVLQELKNGDFDDPERRILVDFLESSQRGITK